MLTRKSVSLKQDHAKSKGVSLGAEEQSCVSTVLCGCLGDDL